MKTVWRALTLMADSVHYFSHNVAFFFFFFLSTWNYLYQDTVTHTFTAHLFTTRKDLSQKYTIRTSNSDTCIAAFSFFLSRPCYSFFSLLFDKVNILCKQRGKTGNITKYVCLSDNNRSIRLRKAHTVCLEAVVTTFCPTQNNLNNTNKCYIGWKLVCDGAPRITCFSLESPYRSAFSLDRLVHSHYRWRTTGISKLHWT